MKKKLRVLRDRVCPGQYESRGGDYFCSVCKRVIEPGEKYTAVVHEKTTIEQPGDCSFFCCNCEDKVEE